MQHCRQHFRFRIGHIVVAIESEHADCSRHIENIISLYEPSSKPPDVTFSITVRDQNIDLSINHQHRWGGTNSGEVIAGFEVYLYTHIVENLTPKLESLHAASIAIHNKACIFAGVSDAGKSSLCTKAVLQGHHYFSDEFSLISEQGNIEPFPRPLQWGKEEHPAFSHASMLASDRFSLATFNFPDTQGNNINTLLWLPKRVQRQALPIQWVILPRYQASADAATLTSIRRGEALMELPQHLHHRQRPDFMLKMLNQRIPKHALFYRLVFSDVHAAWETLEKELNSRQ